MTTKKENKKSKSSFLFKLRDIINDPENSEYIKWRENGFIIYCQNNNSFADNILPKYFKHNSFQSFHKQLNIYNFYVVQNEKKEEKHFCHDTFRPNMEDNEIKAIIKRNKKNLKKKKFKAKILKIEENIQKLNDSYQKLFNFVLVKITKDNVKFKRQEKLINELNTKITKLEEALNDINSINNKSSVSTLINNNNFVLQEYDSMSQEHFSESNIFSI